MQTHYMFSRVRTNVDRDNKLCTNKLTDSGFICSHMWKGTISRENVHLGIQTVNVENTVLSTSFRSYHEECIDLYIYIHVSRLGRKAISALCRNSEDPGTFAHLLLERACTAGRKFFFSSIFFCFMGVLISLFCSGLFCMGECRLIFIPVAYSHYFVLI